jgi:hypothetical protein
MQVSTSIVEPSIQSWPIQKPLDVYRRNRNLCFSPSNFFYVPGNLLSFVQEHIYDSYSPSTWNLNTCITVLKKWRERREAVSSCCVGHRCFRVQTCYLWTPNANHLFWSFSSTVLRSEPRSKEIKFSKYSMRKMAIMHSGISCGHVRWHWFSALDLTNTNVRPSSGIADFYMFRTVWQRSYLIELLLVEKAFYLKSCWKIVCVYFLLLVHFYKQLN